MSNWCYQTHPNHIDFVVGAVAAAVVGEVVGIAVVDLQIEGMVQC